MNSEQVSFLPSVETAKRELVTKHGHLPPDEYDALLPDGWNARKWAANKGYAITKEAVNNSAGETIWCSPHCIPDDPALDLFGGLRV